MLEDLIQAILKRDGKYKGESTIVALHCQQMREWGIRGGNIEHRPIQDIFNERFKYIQKIFQHNQMNERFDYIMDCFICRGEILWYVIPDLENPGLYRIEFFIGGLNNPDPQYKIFYKAGGREIDRVIIRYPYEFNIPNILKSQIKWVKLTITQEYIEQSEFSQKPQFDDKDILEISDINSYNFIEGANYLNPSKKYSNPFYPHLPIAISKNNARQLGQPGSDDFYWIRNLIESLENLIQTAHKNLRIFSNPILITTRSAQEVTKKGENFSSTWAAANRYIDYGNSPYSGSIHPHDIFNWNSPKYPNGYYESQQGSIDTIIGNVGEGERFGFIQAQAVAGDQNLWIKQQRELIHWILGGIDPIAGLTSGTTFGEIKTLFGRIQNTAERKAESLFGINGLSKIYELIIIREEKIFKQWLFSRLKIHPEFENIYSPNQLSDELCQIIWKNKELFNLEDDHLGLIPGGDRKIIWRYTREVFQNTTREELDRSIAARNEREDGLSQEWVLKKQYPNLTDQEIKNAMSGFSPRVVQNAAMGLQATLQLYQIFNQMPDPKNPKIPWGISLGLHELLEQGIHTLKKEISYGIPEYEKAEEINPIDSIEKLKEYINVSNFTDNSDAVLK